jgi:hypothetical protein
VVNIFDGIAVGKFGGSRGGAINDVLPDPSLITDPEKNGDMLFISSKGICGGNDFSRVRLKERRLSARKAENHRAKRVDMPWI